MTDQPERLYTLREAGQIAAGVSESYMRRHLPEFRAVGLIRQLHERRSDRAKLLPESDVLRLRDYLTESLPIMPV